MVKQMPNKVTSHIIVLSLSKIKGRTKLITMPVKQILDKSKTIRYSLDADNADLADFIN